MTMDSNKLLRRRVSISTCVMLFALTLILRIDPVSSAFASQSNETLTQNPDLGTVGGTSSPGGNPGDIGGPPPCDPQDPNCGVSPCDPEDPLCPDTGGPPPCDPQDPSCSFGGGPHLPEVCGDDIDNDGNGIVDDIEQCGGGPGLPSFPG